jgi:predicted solute-binding protein
MTREQIDKKIDDIEDYYNQFNMCSYEYPAETKRQLSRLYNLKLKKMGDK